MTFLLAEPFALPRLTVALAWAATFVIPALVHRRKAPQWRKVALPADRPATLLMAIASLALPVWCAFPEASFWSVPRTAPLRTSGIGTMVFALLLYWRAHRDLGPSWSITVALYERQSLKTQGVYTYIRHPMYAGLLLLGAGYAQLIPSVFPGLLPLGATLLLVAVRLRHEEHAMSAQFGAAWATYSERTKRFIPGIW